jgi:hypothetical protein
LCSLAFHAYLPTIFLILLKNQNIHSLSSALLLDSNSI